MVTRLFSTDTDSGTITVIDVADGEPKVVTKIPVGNGPRGAVKFTTAGRGYVSNNNGDTISEIDALTCRETAQIKVGIAPTGVGVIPGDRFALVSNSGSNYVSVVDLTKRKEIAQIATGREPRHMAITPDGKFAYIAISGSDYISKVDVSALSEENIESIEKEVREVARIFVGEGSCPYSVGIDPLGKAVYSANNQVRYVSVINIETDTVEAEVNVGSKGSRGVAFSPNGDQAFVTVEDKNELVVIDTSTNEAVNRFETSPGPRGLIVDPDTSTIYAAGFARRDSNSGKTPNTLTVLNFASSGFREILKAQPQYSEIPVGAGPCSVSIFKIDRSFRINK